MSHAKAAARIPGLGICMGSMMKRWGRLKSLPVPRPGARHAFSEAGRPLKCQHNRSQYQQYILIGGFGGEGTYSLRGYAETQRINNIQGKPEFAAYMHLICNPSVSGSPQGFTVMLTGVDVLEPPSASVATA